MDATKLMDGSREVVQRHNKSKWKYLWLPVPTRIPTNTVLSIWAGFDPRLGREIWIDNEPDPAILYNPHGKEASRFPFLVETHRPPTLMPAGDYLLVMPV